MPLPFAIATLALAPQASSPTTEPLGPPRIAFVQEVLALPGRPRGVVAATLDAGAIPDVAVVAVRQVGSALVGRLLVLEGLGGGAFQVAWTKDLGSPYSSAHGMRALDFDADGWTDLSVPGFLSSGGLRLGDGTLAFAAEVHVPTVGGELLDLDFADFTGDGLVDSLSLVTDFGGDFVDTAENDGSGGFASLSSTAVAPAAPLHAHLCPADFDGGGLASDFAISSAWGLALYESPPLGSALFQQLGDCGESAAGDLDGDGDPDLVVTRPAHGAVEAYANDGLGGLAPIGTVATGARPEHVRLADMDLDGDLDAVATNSQSGTLRVVWNDGAGVSGASAPVKVGAFPADVTTSDLDLDGDVDVVVANVVSESLSVLRSTLVP